MRFGNVGWGQAGDSGEGWKPLPACPPHSPVSAPALPVLQALAEIPHMIPPVWPLQGSPVTQSRSTGIRSMGIRPTRPSTHTRPPANLCRRLSPRPRSPLDWTLCPNSVFFSELYGPTWALSPSLLLAQWPQQPHRVCSTPSRESSGSIQVAFFP